MDEFIKKEIECLCRQGRFDAEKKSTQHGTTSVYAHSVHVAALADALAEKWKLNVDRRALVRGALLHDYFLYDWHEKEGGHRLHGFRHPYTALKNAENDFDLSDKERNIILRHMFPLVPIPPGCMESWLVCLCDKYCALEETMKRK